LSAAAVWVLVEHDDGELDGGAQQLCSESRRIANMLNEDLWAMLFGHGASDLAPELGRFGVDRALVGESEWMSPFTTEPYTGLLTELVRRHEPQLLLLGATCLGEDLAPRLATRLGVGFVPDCVSLRLDHSKQLVFIRPICGDRAYASFACPGSSPQIATLRLGSFPVEELDDWQPAAVELLEVESDVETPPKAVIGWQDADPRSIELGDADVVVAAGRGVEQADSFDTVQQLADLLEAPLAGSRPLVDLHLIASERQVGQTGVSIAPRLYLACGISGAPQHTMGMKNSELVIALDLDREAPIFGLADLKVVGNLSLIVAALNERLSQLQVEA
jgi:electron transfer flavoprotein alpha subunit